MQQFESFAQMQRDAAARVMEMQRRAQAAMLHSTTPPAIPVVSHDSDSEPLCEPETVPAVPAQEDAVAPDRPDVPEAQDLSQEDTERTLIIAILLLLMREKADERLLFALLYILM